MRQRRRSGGAPSVPAPTVPSTEVVAEAKTLRKPSASAPSRPELACPKCGAVVYAGESRCWKCGTQLTPMEAPTPEDEPLPSSKP